MSARIKRRPAEEVEREIAEAEKIEQRKGDKDSRTRASDHEAAVDAWFRVMGCTIKEQEAVRIFINVTKGSAPDEDVVFSEAAAGALLGDAEGRVKGSLAKRWVREWEIIEALMTRTGKRIGERTPGKMVYSHQRDKQTPKCAKYKSETTQLICDIIRLANLARKQQTRNERFFNAALAVHAELPDYRPALKVVDSTEITREARKPDRAGGATRAMTRLERDVAQLVDLEKEKGAPALLTQYNRIRAKVAEIALPAMVASDAETAGEALLTEFIETAKLQIRLARQQGPEALEALQTRLFDELGALFADPEAPEDGAELVGMSFSGNSQKPQQNRVFGSDALDTDVQSGDPAPCELVYEREVFD